MGKGAEGEEADDAGEDEDEWVECVFSVFIHLVPSVVADQ